MSDIVLTDAPQVALLPLTKAEAEAIAAMDAVLKRYGLLEWLRCRTCYAANRQDGCRSVVTERVVSITCRCGTRQFNADVGTDLRMNRANSALTQANTGEITVVDSQGNPTKMKAIRIEPEDAAIIRLYAKVTGQLFLNSKVAFRDCFRGMPYDAAACEVLVTPVAVAIKCGHPNLTASCRVLHFSGSSTVN